MPTPKLSPEKVAEIWECRERHPQWSRRQIASECEVAAGTVSNVLKAPKRNGADRIDEFAAHHKEKFEYLMERFRKWVGDTGPLSNTSKPKTSKSASKPFEAVVKSLVINDLHSPFLDERAFGQAIGEAKQSGATVCRVAGDIQDLHAVSRYPKTRKSYSLVEEFQGSRATIRTLAENFDHVEVMEGNHDARWFKWLVANGVPPDILEFFKVIEPNALSPLAKICADFPNVKMLPVPSFGNAEYPHLAQVGDCILSHAERYSIIPGKATADVLLFLKKKLEPMGVIKPFKVLIQAHTHQAARYFGDFGVLCIENGCLAQIPDYDGNPKLVGREPILGYTLMSQTNGVTDINATHFYRVL